MQKPTSILNPIFILKFILLGYLLVTIVNLVFIPIAWVDEVMDLDPAIRFVMGEGYNSFLWPYKGSEEMFLANLPLRNVPFLIFSYLFGPDIFWIRLPHVLFLGITCFYLLKLLTHFSSPTIAWVLLLFFVLDKGIYESLRSVRCEMLQVALMSSALYFSLVKPRYFLVIVLSALLGLTHPASWMLSFGLLVFALLKIKVWKYRFFALGLFVLLPLVWLWLIDFNFEGIKNQLFAAGEDHAASGGFLGLLKGHFYSRFSNYIPSQPWVWVAVLFAHFLAIRSIVFSITKKTSVDILAVLLCVHSVFWLFVLAPNYRYNPTLLVLVFILIAQFISKWNFSNQRVKVSVVILLLIQAVPFLGVSFLGLTQRSERNPYKVQEWLSENVPVAPKTLICGESIAAYWSYRNSNDITYCAANYPHKFDFEGFDNLYILTHLDLELKYEAIYLPESAFSFLEKVHSKSNSLTYRGLWLYKVTPEQMRDYCLEIRHGEAW